MADYAIFMLDPAGVVASWNLGAERINGYTADEIIGRHFSVFYSADADSVYLDANDTACRMLGYSHDELVGLHASDIVAEAERTHIDSALNEIHGRLDHHREWKFRLKDGSLFPRK